MGDYLVLPGYGVGVPQPLGSLPRRLFLRTVSAQKDLASLCQDLVLVPTQA